MKILHTADIHLDSPLKSLALRNEDLRTKVQSATRTALVRLVDSAIDLEVAALLISGDLYDSAERSAKTAAFLSGQMERLRSAGIPVFYIKGNHDAENPITGEVALPENVHVFGARGGKVKIPQSDVWIHGVSFSSKHAPDSLLPKFGEPVPDAVNIAMLHTSLSGAVGHDPYAPCTLNQLRDLGFDYWALGHVHKRQIHSQNPWVVMPGIPQGRDIGEAGPQSASLIELGEAGMTVSALPTSVVEFTALSIPVGGCATDDAIRAEIRRHLSGFTQELQSDSAILRTTLCGATSRRWQILRDSDAWTQTIQDMALETGTLWVEKVAFDIAPESDAPDNSATGELQAIMESIRQEDAFAASLETDVISMINDLPPSLRAALLPSEEQATSLAQNLTEQGAAQILARMKGASD
ncbi:exonuclease SbcCD subunit D [Donghicola sp. XS_ASV15]|uniref:metallophosphoesterase family protein n=1 Tax=Donghicola sp. XS_ASV15 TaxID=3241295 RepID=UPI003514402C